MHDKCRFSLYFILIARNAILSGGYLLPHFFSVSIDLGELMMLEVITAKRLYTYTPRSQIWPEYKLKTASCISVIKKGYSFVLCII